MSLEDKAVLITGASSGIGAATAAAFASEGALLTLVGRDANKLRDVADTCETLGSEPLVIVADVTKGADIQRIVSETLSQYGKLDILVNNAGVFLGAAILDPLALEVHRHVMSTNFESVVRLTHLAAPHLVRARGNIVNVSSIAGKAVPMENSFSYLSSKAALDHFTRAIALELAPKGVRVNSVNPGAVRTDIMRNLVSKEHAAAAFTAMSAHTPLQRVSEPEEIAELILFLASDKARSVTGASYVADNGAMLAGLNRSHPLAK